MHYLATHEFKVIALRDLAQYVGTDVEPPEPMAVIEKRKQQLER